MATEKAKRAKTQEPPKATPWRGAAVSAAAAVLTLTAVGMNRGAAWMRSKLADQPSMQLAGMDLGISARPDWLSLDVGERIAQEAGWRADSFDLSESGLVERIAQRMQKSPWVESVRVQKSQRRLDVNIQYRRPLLMVMVGNQRRGFYAAADGTVLPAEGATQSAIDSCLALEGFALAAVPELGDRVRDPRWAEVVRIAESLKPHRQQFPVTTIVLRPETNGVVRYLLRTTGSREILWGPPLPTDAATVECRLPGILAKLKQPAEFDTDFAPKPIDATK